MMAEQGRLAKLSLEQRVSRMEWLLRLLGALSGLSLVGISWFCLLAWRPQLETLQFC